MSDKWQFNVDDTSDGIKRELAAGLKQRVYAGEHAMISVIDIEPNVIGKEHSHPQEQWGFLLEGECIRVQGGEEISMKKGDFWRTPGNIPHYIITKDKKAKIIDVFAPPREDYLKPGSGYGTAKQ